MFFCLLLVSAGSYAEKTGSIHADLHVYLPDQAKLARVIVVLAENQEGVESKILSSQYCSFDSSDGCAIALSYKKRPSLLIHKYTINISIEYFLAEIKQFHQTVFPVFPQEHSEKMKFVIKIPQQPVA